MSSHSTKDGYRGQFIFVTRYELADPPSSGRNNNVVTSSVKLFYEIDISLDGKDSRVIAVHLWWGHQCTVEIPTESTKLDLQGDQCMSMNQIVVPTYATYFHESRLLHNYFEERSEL